MAEEVQKSATVEQIVQDHISGMGGYAIAEKYGIDTEKVKQIINEANDAGKFVPDGVATPVDHQGDNKLEEGKNPEATQETTDSKKSK